MGEGAVEGLTGAAAERHAPRNQSGSERVLEGMGPLTSTITFETAMGCCAVPRTDAAISGVLLPQPIPLRTSSIEARTASIPSDVRLASEGIVAVLEGAGPIEPHLRARR